MTETATSVDMIYSDSAVVKFQLRAPLLLRHLDKKKSLQEFPEGVEIDFFTPDKQLKSRLTAKYAERDEKNKILTVRDSVVLIAAEGSKLEGNELIWDERKAIISSSRFVMFTTPDEKIWGYGFESNEDFTYWKIKAIEGIIKIDGLSRELKQ